MKASWSETGIGLAIVTFLTMVVGLNCIDFPYLPIAPEETDYIGSAACISCHANFGPWQERHGHSQALKRVYGPAPRYPDAGGAGVATMPPDGFRWDDISYVIGGYTKAANFLDLVGFVLTDGTAGTETQYNLAIATARTASGFAPFMPERTEAYAYEEACFRCHTTGPVSLEASGGKRQDNREGIRGMWSEPGVQCEACHGPGNQHAPAPRSNNITVDTSAEACGVCHATPGDPLTIRAANNFIIGNQQYAEVKASPHAAFGCTLCHDPHRSTIYDRPNAIRNECTDCHTDMNHALHEGVVYEWGDYTEAVTCESCHMPYVAWNASMGEVELSSHDFTARIGDTRSHIMRLDPDLEGPAAMFTEDGSRVRIDENGQAAVAVCYSCLRCHHGQGNAFAFPPSEACQLGRGIHEVGQ